MAAVFVNAFALRRKIVQPCISEQKRQREEKQRQCNIQVKFAGHSVRVANAVKIRGG